jgi:hypothetical protein
MHIKLRKASITERYFISCGRNHGDDLFATLIKVRWEIWIEGKSRIRLKYVKAPFLKLIVKLFL